MNVVKHFLLITSLILHGLPALADGLSLSGVVTDAKTHGPIGQAEVTAVGGRSNSDVTDSKGKFVLHLAATVKPGETVELRVRKNGYTTYAEKVSAGELALTIELEPANSHARERSGPPKEQNGKLVEAERALVSESRELGRQVLDISKNGTIEQYSEIRDRAITYRERMTDGLAESFPTQLQVIYHAVEAPQKCKPIGEDLIATADRYYRRYFFENGKPRDALDKALLGPSPDSNSPTVGGGFHELPDEVNVMLGKTGAHIGWWYVRATPWQPFRDTVSMTMSIKSGNLLFTFESQCEGVPIKVVNNAVTVGSYLLDYQTGERAFEVVDRNQDPIFQMIRRSPGTIQINGVFDTRQKNKNGQQILLWASEEMGMTLSAKQPVGFKLKPIFKYPAWKYPGRYAEESDKSSSAASKTEEMQRQILRHSIAVKDFTVDWTVHLPEGFTMSIPTNALGALSALLCRPVNDSISVWDIMLVQTDTAPFGKPKLIMEVTTKHTGDDPACSARTNLVTLNNKGNMQPSNGFGYDLEVVSYDEPGHLLKLRSSIHRYTLVELKTPSFLLSDFGAATARVAFSDEQLRYGLLSYWGTDLGAVTLDQVPNSVDIVVRPDPPEGDVDSHWTITTTKRPPAVLLSTGQLEIPYERRD